MFRISNTALSAINRARRRIFGSAEKISRPLEMIPSVADRQPVSLAEEMVGITIAEAEIRANLKTIETEDQMTGALLDIRS